MSFGCVTLGLMLLPFVFAYRRVKPTIDAWADDARKDQR